MTMLMGALLAAGTATLPNSLPAQVNEKVVVDGTKYRVWIKGRIVKVYEKSAVVKATVETGARMQEAVRKLTSCEIGSPIWVDAHLEGVLECPE